MYCKNCGSTIDDDAVICPKCGVQVGKLPSSAQNKTNTLALVGFIMSFFVAIAGLVCSIMGRNKCKETGEGGMGLATAGMIISIVSLVMRVVGIIIYIALVAAVAAAY